MCLCYPSLVPDIKPRLSPYWWRGVLSYDITSVRQIGFFVLDTMLGGHVNFSPPFVQLTRYLEVADRDLGNSSEFFAVRLVYKTHVSPQKFLWRVQVTGFLHGFLLLDSCTNGMERDFIDEYFPSH